MTQPTAHAPHPGALAPASRAPRALVIDDNRETRDWIAETLAAARPDAMIDLAASCAQARALLFDPAARSYDFALIDLELPDGSGLDIIRAVVQQLPQTQPVVITIFDDDATLFEALSAGAAGYILKGVRTASLIEQFRRIEAGEPPISPRIAQRILAHFRAGSATAPAPRVAAGPAEGPALTQREQEVLRYLAKGLTVTEIGAALGISGNTCATHTKSIYRKLNISSRAEAALAAERRGLI